jgi:hypothetical protein
MYTPHASEMTPPPGLNTFDSMVPAKVEVFNFQRQPSHKVKLQPSMDYVSVNEAAQFSSGEWATKVHSVAPFLNTKGLHRALAILDQAIFNVQRVKAMDDILASTQQANGDVPYDHFSGLTCRMCQVQVYAEQQQLLAELQQLPYDPCSVRRDFSHPPTMAQNQLQHRLMSRGAQSPLASPMPPGKMLASDSPKATQKAAADRSKAALGASARRVQTLSTSLQLLSNEDPDCLFIVRRINKLGFKAVRTLKRHFSAQGPVAKVLLAHSTVRQHGDPTCHARRRPSSLGFVQMANAESVIKVLALGAEQEVDGVLIRVQCFERQRIAECEKEENDAEEAELAASAKFERGLSEASTTTAASSPNNIEKVLTSESDEE